MKRYKEILKELKDPYSEMGFEKKFIGKELNSVMNGLSKYSLEDQGVSPVIDKNNKIIGFIYDQDSDAKFKGKNISDFGIKSIKNFQVYEV